MVNYPQLSATFFKRVKKAASRGANATLGEQTEFPLGEAGSSRNLGARETYR